MEIYHKIGTGKINRRGSRSEGSPEDVYIRENLLPRGGVLNMPKGTKRSIDTVLTDKPMWMARYHSIEVGITSPKSYAYTKDGKLWRVNDQEEVAKVVSSSFKTDAYPKSWLFKKLSSTIMYLVDGENLYKYDGNNDDNFEVVGVGNFKPKDIIEHKDRSVLLGDTSILISKNLDFDTFDDATDSIEIIIGSGKGKNLALGKIEDNLYIFNTEGIFALVGDVISALAITFEVRLVDEKRIIAGRTVAKVEKALMFLADDLNVYSWDGNSTIKMSHDEKLEDFINPYREYLDKAVATNEDNYYKLSFVETWEVENKLEWWWDAFENKSTFVRGRNVAFYMQSDPTIELSFFQFCDSTQNTLLWANRGFNFDGSAIQIKLWTKNITLLKNHNVRIQAFYPDFECVGARSIDIQYLLDSRLSPTTPTKWSQRLQGETFDLGSIPINNQSDISDRIRPKISYSRGETICFVIDDSTLNARFTLKGIGIEYIDRGKSRGRTVGK